MKSLTRRAFLKLASLCGAVVAGLVGLPNAEQGANEEEVIWANLLGGEWHVVPPPELRNEIGEVYHLQGRL